MGNFNSGGGGGGAALPILRRCWVHYVNRASPTKVIPSPIKEYQSARHDYRLPSTTCRSYIMYE